MGGRILTSTGVFLSTSAGGIYVLKANTQVIEIRNRMTELRARIIDTNSNPSSDHPNSNPNTTNESSGGSSGNNSTSLKEYEDVVPSTNYNIENTNDNLINVFPDNNILDNYNILNNNSLIYSLNDELSPLEIILNNLFNIECVVFFLSIVILNILL